MPLYTTDTVPLPYPPHYPCSDHEDCRNDPEMARLCAMSDAPKPYAWRRNPKRTPVLAFRKVVKSRYYNPRETEPGYGANDRDVTWERRDGDDQIIYTRTSHTEHTVYSSYEGSVVRLWSDPNGRIMSDVWGTVYWAEVIDEQGELVTFTTGNCDCVPDTCGLRDAVDVAPEAWERHRLFRLRMSIAEETERAEQAARKIAEDKAKAARDARAPRKGARVKVIGARGKGAPPKGSIGECFWVGESTYQPRYGRATVTKRVGLIVDGVKYFTAASNVELA